MRNEIDDPLEHAERLARLVRRVRTLQQMCAEAHRAGFWNYGVMADSLDDLLRDRMPRLQGPEFDFMWEPRPLTRAADAAASAHLRCEP